MRALNCRRRVALVYRLIVSGAAWVTAVLVMPAGSHADAPNGRYVVSAGTVYDTRTKLTWQQTIVPSTYKATESLAYCASLGASLGGGGWRVPSIKELLTLLDHSQTSGPFIDRTAFPATPLHMFWSSTPLAGGASGGPWVVDFLAGTATLPGMSDSNYVRCVR
jgi:hypothetical protein